MVEEQEAKGVLTEGKDTETFSRKNFEKYLENIIKDITKKGIRKKPSVENYKSLLPEKKLSQKPVLSFSLNFTNDRLNLECVNIGNDLAEDIKFTIKTKKGAIKPELKITHNGLTKGDSFLINNWQKSIG